MRDDAMVIMAVLLAAILAVCSFMGGRDSGLDEGESRAAAALAPLAGVEIARVSGAWTISGGGRVVVGETLEEAAGKWMEGGGNP